MTFKNENDTSITIKSDMNFKKKGEEWVPTTLNAYVVNVLDLERAINIRFRQVVLGASTNIAIGLPTLSNRPPRVPAYAPLEPMGDAQAVRTILDRIEQLQSAPDWWKTAYERKLENFPETERMPAYTYKNELNHAIEVRVLSFNSLYKQCYLKVVIDEQVVSISRRVDKCEEWFWVPPKSAYAVHLLPNSSWYWAERR